MQHAFKALSDPTRREILKQLASRSMSAGELANLFPMSRASMSHHFNVLKVADLVRAERHGQSIVYSINSTVAEQVVALLLDLFDESRTGKPIRSSRART